MTRIRKRKRERQTERRLRRFYDSGLVGVITWTVDGKILDANDEFLAITGYSREDLEAGQIDWARLTPPEFTARDEASLDELRKTGRNQVPFEKEYFRKDGSRVPVLVAGSMLDTQRTQGVAFVLDLSELHNVRGCLAEEQSRHRELFDTVNVGIVRSTPGPRSRIIDANPAALRIFGAADLDEFLSVSPINLYFDHSQRQRVIDGVLSSGSIAGIEIRFRRLDGRPFWGRISAVQKEAGDGTIYLDNTIEDISEQKAAEEALRQKTSDLESAYEELTATEEELRENYEELARGEKKLRESEQRLRRFYDSGLVGVITWSTEGRILDANDAFLGITGYTRSDLEAGRIDWAAMTPPEYCDRDAASLAELRKFGKNQVPFEKEYFRKDGSRVPVLVAGAMLDDDRTRGVAFVLDITERKAAEEAVRQRTVDLEASYEELTATEEELRANYEALARSEQELRESEARYRSLFANMQEGLAYCRMIYDADGNPSDFVYLSVNPAFDRIIGAGTVIGKPVTEVFPGIRDAFPRLFAIYGRVARTAVPESFDIEFTPSGRWLHVSAYSPAQDHFVAVFSDITDKKTVEVALRESEERLRLAQDAANAGTWEWVLATNENFWSEKTFRLYNLDPQVITSSYDAWLGSIHPDDRAAAAKSVGDAAAAGIPVSTEWRVNLPGGEERWLMSRGQPVQDTDGKVVKYLGIVIDITERRQMENALRTQKAQLRQIIDLVPNLLFTKDGDGNYLMVNSAVAKGYNLTVAEVEGKPHALFHKDFEEIRQQLEDDREVLRTGKIKDVPEEYYTDAFGKRRYLHTTKVPFNTADTNQPAILGIAIDITERKRAEEQREALIRTLELKNAELERFTYTVSHDLKTPLITILGYAGLMQESIKNGEMADLDALLGRITSAAQTMEALLADVLQLSRIGRIVSLPENVSFTVLAREAADLVAISVQQRGVLIEIEPGMPVVHVDQNRVREALVNLIENAVKYMGDQPDPRIRIGVVWKEESPVFFVGDNGIGINPAYCQRIFKLFEKLHPGTPGTGVGLAIVKRIIEIHGGKIWAESGGEGRGTTFWFTLPGNEPARAGALTDRSR